MFAISREAGGDDRWQRIRSLAEKRAAEEIQTEVDEPMEDFALTRRRGGGIDPQPLRGAAVAPSSTSPGLGSQGARVGSEFQQLLAYGLKALARREHSAVELRRKLGNHRALEASATDSVSEPSPIENRAELIDRVIEALQLDGSQSDERFTAEFVRIRVNKGYGPIRIRMDLLERGVPDRLAEEALTRPAAFWQQRAAEVCARKFGSVPLTRPGDQSAAPQLDDRENEQQAQTQRRWNRCARFLSQRGFPADLIYQTLEGRLVE